MVRLSGAMAIEAIGRLCGAWSGDRGVHDLVMRLDESACDADSDGGRDGGHVLPIRVLCYPGPTSYTGEDSVELVLPGNRALIERVLDLLVSMDGVEMAQPGEFSARAYLNHRLTLQQAEGIALRIADEHGRALAAAGSLLDGSFGALCQAWTDEIATLLALVEAGVDFSDQEDVIPIEPSGLVDRLETLASALRGQVGRSSGSKVDTDLATVVLVGVPNAGKSSLFNALLGYRRSAVRDQAGTTRDAIREELDLGAVVPGAGRIELVDVAGLCGAGEKAIDEVDAQAQRLAREIIGRATMVIWCDPFGRFDETAISESAGLISSEAMVLRVRTKSDLPMGDSGWDGLSVCSIDGSAMGSLFRAIADATAALGDGDGGDGSRGVGSFVPRYRRAIRDAIDGVEAAMGSVDGCSRVIEKPELVAIGLRSALDALGELVGEVSPDDVIGRVFASFCVGK